MMRKTFQLKIRLLSDLCASDGGVYNRTLDINICHDKNGFPYIPAKRIKGCLRQCALELQEWGMKIPISQMFGDGGQAENRAKVRLGNAYLDGYEEMKAEVQSAETNLVFHPQNILDHFSYIRTQTGINYKTGAAEQTSLRTMRVANKGLLFIAQADVEEEFEKDLKTCCKVFTNMGIGRTRGLGEIQVTLEQECVQNKESQPASLDHAPYLPHATRLDYEIYLQEPVICKSVNGGEARTLDYLEGSKILGLIAQGLKEAGEDFIDFMQDGSLFCSNAYIQHNGKRCTEVPASFYSIKDQEHHYVNKFYEEENTEQRQMSMMKHCYVQMEEEPVRKNVKVEVRYHHRRPEDKSIGRAVESAPGDSQFFHMASIQAGQRFQGYVTGTEAQIKKGYDILTAKEAFYLGYAHSAEYGKTRICVKKMDVLGETVTYHTKTWSVKLEAPALIYNDRAFFSTDKKDLISEINVLLGITDVSCETRVFAKYTTVGGYNVTWNKRKPVTEAFDKGTIVYYEADKEIDLKLPQHLLIGERVAEGFGEVCIQPLDGDVNQKSGCFAKEEETKQESKLDLSGSPFAKELCRDLLKDYIKIRAMQNAKTWIIKKEITFFTARSTVRNLILMCKTEDSFETIKGRVKLLYEGKIGKKEKKFRIAQSILCQVEDACEDLPQEFCKKYEVKGEVGHCKEIQRNYLEAFLQQLRYEFRRQENERKGGSTNE